MILAKKKYFQPLKKATWLTAALFYFCFFFGESYGNTVSKTGEETTFTSISSFANGESIIIASPGVPAAACVTKSNTHSTQGSNEQGFSNPSYHSSFSEK